MDVASGYRTNVVFTNPSASDATVDAKVRRGDGTLVSEGSIGPLPANGFTQIGNGPPFAGVAGTNDTNLWLEFTSDQPVLAFASVINNASGDPFAIVTTAEPNVSALGARRVLHGEPGRPRHGPGRDVHGHVHGRAS